MGHTTMEDVARRAGVSRSLVSLVMRDSPGVSPERRRRVLDAASALGYSPNAMARGLASRQSGIVAVLLNDLHNPFFAEIFDGLSTEAAAHGLRLLLGSGGPRRGDERSVIESFLQFRPDGVVLVSPRPGWSISALAATTPVVVVGRTVRAAGVDIVMTDEAAGTQMVVDHLTGLGHRSIVHLDGGQGAGAPARRQGFLRAMKRAGLGNAAEIVPADYTERAGADAASALLARPNLPTAVFAANDLAAVGAIDTFGRAGREVPDALSVVGYDNSFFAHLRRVSLTTVDQPRAAMGRLAMSLLAARIGGRRGPAEVHLAAPTLVVRDTTGPPRPA